MAKTTKPTKLRIRHWHLLSVIVVLLVVGSVVYYGTRLLASHADTSSGYYSCNSGDSLNGSTCTHSTTYTATTNTGSCNKGDTQQGTSCTHTYAASSNTTSNCNNGDSMQNGTCYHTYPASAAYCNSGESFQSPYCESNYNATYNCNGGCGYKCNSGDTLVVKAQNHTCFHSRPACANGDSLNGSTCYHSYDPTTSTTYSCDPGDSRSGSTCYHAYTVDTSYSCNNGDSLSGSTCTHTTTYPATYHAPNNSGGGSTGGGGSSSTTTSKKSSSSAPVALPVAPQPPSPPSNFTATVKSSKVVQLTWNVGPADAGVKDYDLQRSSDNNNWATFTTTDQTLYSDTTTDFSTTYYYRIRELDNNGTYSDYANTQVTTDKFTSSSSTITSDDKLVTVHIPNGAFDQELSCSVSKSSTSPPGVNGKLLLVGPYEILCITENGTIVASFVKPLAVTMSLAEVVDDYNNFEVRLANSSGASILSSKYDLKAKTIAFSIKNNKSFAVYGAKHTSAGSVILKIFLLLLLLAAAGAGAFYLRRYWAGRSNNDLAPLTLALAAPVPAMPSKGPVSGLPAPLPSLTPLPLPVAPTPMASAATAAVATGMAPTPEQLFEQAAMRPSCTHLSMAHQVQPQTTGCAECMAGHKKWKGLRICLTCGHVGCSDDSKEQHALKHFEQTGHPLIYDYADPAGDKIGWCYIDQTYI